MTGLFIAGVVVLLIAVLFAPDDPVRQSGTDARRTTSGDTAAARLPDPSLSKDERPNAA